MRSLGRTKIGLDAEVQLQSAAVEPRAPARSEIRGLGNFLEAQKPAVKAPYQRFAAGGHGQLDVIDSVNGHCELL
jgi:hypothetical protein